MAFSSLLAAGYQVQDFGRMEVDALIQKTLEAKIECLLISTLMLPSALRGKAVCGGLEKNGATTRVVVGGAPFRFDRNLGWEVGADAVGYSASDAVSIVAGYSGERV